MRMSFLRVFHLSWMRTSYHLLSSFFFCENNISKKFFDDVVNFLIRRRRETDFFIFWNEFVSVICGDGMNDGWFFVLLFYYCEKERERKNISFSKMDEREYSKHKIYFYSFFPPLSLSL